MTTTEHWLSAIRDTYTDLDGWQARAKKMPPEQPEGGSLLAADDALFPWHPISEASRISLVVAGEHLRLARTAIEARQVYPSAHFTALRGALVGAAQGVWVLCPSDPHERQERGLTLISEMYGQLRKYYTELATGTISAENRRALDAQLIWCDERRQQVAAARRTAAHLNQTEMIAWALHHRFPDDKRRAAGRLLWRQMGADAHVLGWGMFQRGTVLKPDRKSGLGVGEAGGSLEHLADAFVAIHLLLREGWSRFDQLCEAPRPAQ